MARQAPSRRQRRKGSCSLLPEIPPGIGRHRLRPDRCDRRHGKRRSLADSSAGASVSESVGRKGNSHRRSTDQFQGSHPQGLRRSLVPISSGRRNPAEQSHPRSANFRDSLAKIARCCDNICTSQRQSGTPRSFRDRPPSAVSLQVNAKESAVQIPQNLPNPSQPKDQTIRQPRRRPGFGEDFKRFFIRGLAAILPTLVTLWLLVWAWDFLWQNIGIYILNVIRIAWDDAIGQGWLPFATRHYIISELDPNNFGTKVLGVGLSIILVYVVGVFVGNLIGRA